CATDAYGSGIDHW
nr:immunoglobulin heavy chain junction region [Macaca mulatta]MOW78396.1 immunoglobulin heavy chain junction region [Macaca mulatta]MOW78713.1 immunoglobulin heavy chain junction region [Macaca mulatta]MOW79400.1 immunoglobulin heavy chain junction region [Macaca mulatta]MOW79870.1 immunoglobulin heavy chain junction region [Macaca mulatta]